MRKIVLAAYLVPTMLLGFLWARDGYIHSLDLEHYFRWTLMCAIIFALTFVGNRK